MDNPSALTLCAVNITTPLTAQEYSLPNASTLLGMTAVTLEFEFLGGTGGATASATVRTRLGAGAPWRDIARADFTTTPATKHCNLEGLLSKAMTVYAALAAEGVNDGVLGDDLEVVVTSTGTYTNTQLNVFAQPR